MKVAQPDDTAGSPARRGHLRELLIDVGVCKERGLGDPQGWRASGWSARELANYCDHRIGYSTWHRLVADRDKPYLCAWESLPVIVDTLRRLGAVITLEHVQEAWIADKSEGSPSPRYDTLQSGAAPTDVMASVIKALPSDTDRVRLMLEVARMSLTHEQRLELAQGFIADIAAEGQRERQRTRGQQHDDDDGPGPRLSADR